MTRLATQRNVKRASGVAPEGQALHSVLVPVDLTPRADRVLDRVALLPLAQHARVRLLHVIPSSLSAPDQRRAERDAQRTLAEEVRYLRKQIHKSVSTEALVNVGAAAREIAACAVEAESDLIVMGRGGGRVLREAFLGSTAERVIRQAQRPVLVVRLRARGPYRRPALALDLDDAAREVVRLMLLVLPPPRPPIEVVHAFDAPYRNLIYPSLTESEVEERNQELRSKAVRQLNELLAAALDEAKVDARDRPFFKTHVRQGSPRLVVEKALEKLDADLLVLGTRACSGAAFVLLGTVAGDLLRAAKCDVLVVPPAPARS